MSIMKASQDIVAKVGYNYISGNCGLKVSNICLGTMTMGTHPSRPPGSDEAGAHVILDKFVELGGNFVDTANCYHFGESETIIGNWIKSRQNRRKIVLATKVRIPMGAGPNECGLSRHHILESVEDSLRRLQTNYIDLLQIHNWDNGTPLEETLSVLNDLVRSGKVRYLGASNLTGWQMQKIVSLCDKFKYDKFITLQSQYNLLVRECEMEAFEVCRNEGIGILPWSPLKGGLLTDKYGRGMDEPPSGTRTKWSKETGRSWQSHPDWNEFKSDEKYLRILDTLKEVAKRYKKTSAQIAVRWLLQKQAVSSVVIGAKSIEQLESNIEASVGWYLTDEEMAELDKASDYTKPYPYITNRSSNVKRSRDVSF